MFNQKQFIWCIIVIIIESHSRIGPMLQKIFGQIIVFITDSNCQRCHNRTILRKLTEIYINVMFKEKVQLRKDTAISLFQRCCQTSIQMSFPKIIIIAMTFKFSLLLCGSIAFVSVSFQERTEQGLAIIIHNI